MMSPRARALDFWPIGPSGRRFGDDAGKEAQLKVVVERCAGLDVHKDSVVACGRTPDPAGVASGGGLGGAVDR